MSTNRIISLPYLNYITPCVKISGSLAQPAAALIEGAPGIGKSAMNSAACRFIKANFSDVVLSTHEPPDVGGYPWPDKDRVRFLPADWLVEAQEAALRGQKAIIMLDEFNWAVPAMQSAAMRLILERRAGQTQLDPDLVRFLVVMNPTEYAEGAYDLLDPVRNRVTHYKVDDPGVENYIQWLTGGSDESESLPTHSDEAWYPHWARNSALIAAYLRARPSALFEKPTAARGRALMSYATRRSWTSLALLHATCDEFGWSWAEHDVACGSIGEPNAKEYGEWKRVMDIGDPEEFLKKPTSVPFDAKRDDRMFAILSAIATSAVQPQKRRDAYAGRWNAATECIQHLKEKGLSKGIATVAFRTLIHRDNRPKGEALTPLVIALHKELSPLVALTVEA